ncbi:HsdR family type I site-specific deoxyribonuclease [Mycoplasma wenyonii str. Massachusetts]|uniref:Type I restriction enzyme endonuclease subunit n=1 Tax=Mycoplasma wenyonii (strain Massachusetts) TaxID=1197325 RepID=I6ZF98_MYCWM|nr:HsdR family type I site-specific deoxyribonuclease [Mycoplasma wenyonii]AFN65267.1 HsdR family type I site-specific deoxyribonuclease [Mycoplasma wenyonii str. Massachusetts]
MFSTKQELIDHVITLLRREGYSYTDGKNLRKDATEVFLLDDLENFLSSKYSWLKEQDIYAILPKVRKKEGKFHDFNKDFFQKLREGYVYKRAGELNSHSIHLIDFSNVESNIFRVVSGLSFSTNLSAVHNTDLIVYINGIPFIVWAFKDPQEKLQGAETLIKDTLSGCLPELLRYNAFCVICNGINKTKYGISWGEYRDYREWKRVDEKEQPSNENILVSTIRGLFNQERLLKVLESFICFADSNSREKIICRYPQFFASIKLLKSIEEHSKVTEKGDGKGGIYFGTAGCGKSYTMLFLAKLLQKSKLLNNPTIVLITDRISLNRQLHKLFSKHKDYLSYGEIDRVQSGENLRKVLSGVSGGGIYSTTIQKFRDFGDEALSERANIICIADEAHRSQDCESNKWGKKEDGKWDVSKPLAKVLRDCLPNATYIGFTATPKTNTLEVFGEIVDSYGMRQSIDDGFTVEIDTTWVKTPEFGMNEEVAFEMESVMQEMLRDGIPEAVVRAEARKRATARRAYVDPARLRIVAKNIVERYEKRIEEGRTVEGKAMIVAQNKWAACKYYRILKELRPQWFEKDDREVPEKSMVNVIVSSSETDSEEIKELLWDDKTKSNLLTKFKEDKSSFKIAIVCEMWLTGVDVPSLDTMFLDRYIEDHALLVQAISRVNRDYPKKSRALVVFYVSLQKHLREALNALKELGDSGGVNDSNDENAEFVRKVIEKLNELFLLEGKDLKGEIPVADEQIIKGIVAWIIQQDKEFKEKFYFLGKELIINYKKCAYAISFEEGEKDKFVFWATLWMTWIEPSQAQKGYINKLNELEPRVFRVLEEQESVGYDYSMELYANAAQSQIIEDSNETTWFSSRKNIDKYLSEMDGFIQNLQDIGTGKAISFKEKIEDLIYRLNSAHEQGEKADELLKELAQVQRAAKEEYSEEMKAMEENRAILNVISQILKKNVEKVEESLPPEEKITHLAQGIKEIRDAYEGLISADMKVETGRKMRKEMKLFLHKEGWSKEMLDDTVQEWFAYFVNLSETKKDSY